MIIFNILRLYGVASQAALKSCPQSIWPVARRRLDQINRVRELNELQVPPGNRLKLLKGCPPTAPINFCWLVWPDPFFTVRARCLHGIDLGRGKRLLVKGGAYDAAYQITVPREMAAGTKQPLY